MNIDLYKNLYKDGVLYRGEKYKVLETNSSVINGQNVLMLRLKHKKYNLWVNANYVVRC